MKFKDIIKSNTGFNKLLYFVGLPTIYKLGSNIKTNNPKIFSISVGCVHLLSDYKYKTWPFFPYRENINKNYPIWTSYIAVIGSLIMIKKDVKKSFKVKPLKKKSGILLLVISSIILSAHTRQIFKRDSIYYLWMFPS